MLYRSRALCQSECVLKESECSAFYYNKTSTSCELGNIIGTNDVVYLHPNYGIIIHVDKSVGFLPEPQPHLYHIDHTQYEFNLVTGQIVAPSLIPEFASDTHNMAVGMVYKRRGFFVCAKVEATCRFLPFGAAEWVQMPGMKYPRIDMDCVQLGPNTMWVLGGIDAAGGDLLGITEIYANDKWILGPEMPANIRRMLFGAAKVAPNVVVVFGGCNADKSVSFDTTYEYNFATQRWTRKADMIATRYAFSAHSMATLANGTRVIPLMGGAFVTGTLVEHLDVYNVDSDFWVRMPNPNSSPFIRRPSAVYGSKFYLFGRATSKAIKFYDLDTQTWVSTGANVPALDTYTRTIIFNL